MYCNCFSTTGLSFTIVSFSGGQNKARLQLWKAILFSSATLFILLILHLHIHYELRKIPVPKPPSKAAAISQRKPWPLCFPNEDVRKAWITPAVGSGAGNQWSHRTPERAQCDAAVSCCQQVKKSYHDEPGLFRANHSQQFSEKISVLLIAARVLLCCSRSGYVKPASHAIDWTPFFSTHLDRTSAVITTESWGGTKQQKNKFVLENCGVAMFVATAVFRNEGAIYWNGEISDFHNTSCSGTALCSLPTTYHGVSGPPAAPTQLLLGQQIMPQTIHIDL